MPSVDALCTSPAKGTPKKPVPAATFRADHGIVDDAHAGPGHRQVSILDARDIESARDKLPSLAPGAFAENVILAGLELDRLGLGSLLRLGRDVTLSVTQIGKTCHRPCHIQAATGDCIMPRLGLFARVQAGGTVQAGDPADVVQAVPRSALQAVVLTISDRCSRGLADDTAGPAVARLLQDALDAHLYAAEIIPDEQRLIAERLRHYCDGHSIDLVLAVGGTGFAPRDVTPEAARAIIERLTPGLDEAMRAASRRDTPHAMLSRAVSGIRQQTLIVTLPGSRRAATENLQAVLPALAHGLAKLRGDQSDCGRASPDVTHA